ncbi:MAG: DUF3592 domain-containing protein [Chromatiales bacterium]|nr:MAG: DUF3592 domain-containing protein [Chromatiales bacterium]
MKGKIFTSIFALPFAGVGVWMLWSISTTVLDAWEMRAWLPAEAQVISAGYTTGSGDDSDTYEAYAEYRYYWNGQTYTGDRVSISSGGDNIGDYQTETGRRLSAAQRSGQPVTVYVNPDQPSEAIVNRDIRWGMVGFKSIFVFVFGGVGFGLLYAAFRAPKEKDATLPRYAEQPWLLNNAWQTEIIRSGSKAAMWGAWAFAAFWNLVSAPLPFVLFDEVTNKQNYIALVGLLFPLVGIGLLWWAISRTLEWRRFGPAPFTMDPFPGAIGGHVGGAIDLNLPFDPQARFQLTLTNIYSYESGSGKDRSRKETAEWQDKLVAHAEPSSSGTRLAFRFDVPDELQASDAQQDGKSYHLWRLNLKAELAGPDIDRDYEIPVYATGAESRWVSAQAARNARSEQNKIDDAAVIKAVEIRSGTGGRELFYPMGRNLGPSMVGFIIGGVFASVGGFLVVNEGHLIFGGIFGLVGSIIAIASLYMMFNSLEVSQDGMSIKTVRRILGIPIKRRSMRRASFARFSRNSSMQSHSGNKHVMYYSISAVDRQGDEMTVGEGFKGDNEADAAIRMLSRELRLKSEEATISHDVQGADEDVLAADS